MSQPSCPAGENLFYLQQGIDLIRDLAPEAYAGDPGDPARRGVGAHFRHCLDFYRCFLDGVNNGKIDYCARRRETRVEVDREHAIRAFEQVMRELQALDSETLAAAVEVRVERSDEGVLDDASDAATCGSSVMRELQFMVSHTVHHYAIIKLHLTLQGHDGAGLEAFGVAPSTRSYWQRTG